MTENQRPRHTAPGRFASLAGKVTLGVVGAPVAILALAGPAVAYTVDFDDKGDARANRVEFRSEDADEFDVDTDMAEIAMPEFELPTVAGLGDLTDLLLGTDALRSPASLPSADLLPSTDGLPSADSVRSLGGLPGADGIPSLDGLGSLDDLPSLEDLPGSGDLTLGDLPLSITLDLDMDMDMDSDELDLPGSDDLPALDLFDAADLVAGLR